MFSPTCLSICSFQGSRRLTNLRVVEAQRRYNAVGFWFDLRSFMHERKLELCDKPLGRYLLIGTPILVYNLSNGTESVYQYQYFPSISAKTNLGSRIGSLHIQQHTPLRSAHKPVCVWRLPRTDAQSHFLYLRVDISSRVRGILGFCDSCAARPASHASLLR